MRNLTMAIFVLIAGFLMGIGFSTLLKEDITGPLHQAMTSYQENLISLDTKVSALTKKVDSIVSMQTFVQTRGTPMSPVEIPGADSDSQLTNMAESQTDINTDQSDFFRNPLNSPDTQLPTATESATQDNFIQAELLFQQEPYDQQWSLLQQEKIYALFNSSDKFTGLNISEVLCRSHSCRLELIINDAETGTNLESVVIEELAPTFPNATWKHENNYMTLLVSKVTKPQ